MAHGELYRLFIGVVHVATVWLAADNVRLRLQRRRRQEEDANRAARALAGRVVIAGVELPLPDDSRWAQVDCQYTKTVDIGSIPIVTKATLPALRIGPVAVGGSRLIGYNFIHINGEPIEYEASKANRAYADEVWRCYRTRLVSKTL